MENETGILNLDCFNNYKKTKEAILNSKVIEDNIIINEFFIVIDDCADHLRQFGNFENSIKEISDFLYEKDSSWWINLLIDKIFDNFTGNISKNYDENLFKTMKKAESTVKYTELSSITNHKSSLFIYIFLLISMINKNNDVKLLEKAASRINEKNILSDKIDIFIFWMIMRILINSKKIEWRDKEHIFWNWNKNPDFNFFNKENFNTIPFELIFQFEIFSMNIYIFIFNFIELLKSIKNIKDDRKECLRKELLEPIISSLNRDIEESLKIVNKDYFDFNELLHLHENLCLSLANTDFLNRIIQNIIPIKKEEKKKLEEACYLYDLLDLEFKEKIEIKKTESPDFIIKTKNNERIGIELIRIESEKEHKERTDYYSEMFYIDPSGSDLINQVITKIQEKFKKCNRYNEKRANGEFDKLWLYVHSSIPSKTSTKNIILNYTNNSAPLIERIRDLARDENNCFNAIVWNNNKILLK